MRTTGHVEVGITDGKQKTALLHELAIAYSTDDLVRSSAQKLMRATRADEHVKRLERIDRFCKALPYYNESVEMFQPAAQTLMEGGDCDDHVLTKCALAWALRYPFYCEPAGDIAEPYHYTSKLGYPPNDHPWGDKHTKWICSESTIPASFGEHFQQAVKRWER